MGEKLMRPPIQANYLPLIKLAHDEDLGRGDITSQAMAAGNQTHKAKIIFRQKATICGLVLLEDILKCYDAKLIAKTYLSDGSKAAGGQSVAEITGPLSTLLAGERVILNFLQRLSGIATTTAQYVEAAANPDVKICDTRKTTPGWRELEKYAVRCGGGHNHRRGLYDAALIKDNHLAALKGKNLADGLETMITKLLQNKPKPDFIEVEVDSLEQLQTVLFIDGIDIILLDNMTSRQMAEAVQIRQKSGQTNILLEASGNITLKNIAEVAAAGVDRISVGALTHSANSIDIAMELLP
jgi:nicotinate-nucleotide pyrophosphorylase (carboxylating)